MSQITREYPHFFPGQWIDYRDFNRLVNHSETTLATTLRSLFQEGGIVSGVAEEFRATVVGGFLVRIGAGTAVLPNGELCVLQSPVTLDLSRYFALEQEISLRVCIRNVNLGRDYSVDPDDPLVAGYRTTEVLAEVEVGLGQSLENSVELFRIQIVPDLESVEELQPSEWVLPRPGQIDLHHVRRIEGYASTGLDIPSAFHWRTSLVKLEEVLFRLQKIYLIEDHAQVGVFVAFLHLELLGRPLQMQKAQFLLEEVAGRLCDFLDRFLREVSTERFPGADREVLTKILPKLEILRKREFFPLKVRMPELMEAIELLYTFSQVSSGGIDFTTRVRTSIEELSDSHFEYLPRMLFAGYSFDLVDRIGPSDEEKIVINTSERQKRGITARYLNGDLQSLTGLILKDGELEISVQVRHIDRPLVLLFKQYIRRGGLELEYTWNGKWIHLDQFQDTNLSNNWINSGIVVPSDVLVINENRLKVKLASNSHDFGFFGVVAYQPFLLEPSRSRAR